MLGRLADDRVPEDGGVVMEEQDGAIDYEPPAWGLTQHKKNPITLSLESPLRNGRTMETFDLSQALAESRKGHFTIGRLPSCDIYVDHLSISRTHAILQFARDGQQKDGEKGQPTVTKERSRPNLSKGTMESENGGETDHAEEPSIFVYDLSSKHGTYVNDRRISAREYTPVRPGDVLRFGDCPRSFTLIQRHYVQMNSKKMKQPEKEEEKEEVDKTEEVDEETNSACDHLNQDEDVDGETPHLLCVDVGTSGLRAYAYDVGSSGSGSSSGSSSGAKGKSKHDKPAASCRNRGGFYQSLPTLYPQPGWVEQDPYVLLDTFRDVVNKVLKKTRITAAQVKAIGITTQRASFLLWNKETGRPLCNFITWQDVRTVGICEEWNDSYAFRGIHAFSKFAHIVTRRTRHLMGSIFKFSPIHCTPRLMWAMKNVEGAQELAAQGKLLFGTTDTWILWNLTGGKVHATDYSNASATGLYDTFELGWNQQLFSVVGLPASIFPEVRPTSGDFGSTLPRFFGAAIPIRAIVADQQAALFGECCFDVGDCKVTIGTGCFIDINTGSQPLVSTHGLLPLIAWAIGKEITYMIEGPMPSVGSVIDWGSREMGWYDHAKETEGMATSVDDTHGVYFVPAFSGLAAPHQDPTARGTILGMTTSTKKQHLVRAMLESIGYTCNDLLETMKADLPNLRVSPLMKIDGGVSQNDFVNQFIANMTGREIIRHPHPDQMTALGAAFLAGLGAGIWKSKEELKGLRASMHRFTPEFDEETRRTKYAAWKRAVERAMHWAQDDGHSPSLPPPHSPALNRSSSRSN
ncbi:glycerol kinase [Acanthamoeba castellanii str. Neff]|uniref:Glycerol kinase 5 n=1 Tax=Acanthamoeba castellanii (strain ATCC 30010 / Neff) TaxID=1257118 RepID=L8HDR1_ACACF|nr:glycerol kinase [Acanthamoeba castellanii str. Neff]ELR23639.1 glycerol kinase [Acanthamoeba castellanii str. Neff]